MGRLEGSHIDLIRLVPKSHRMLQQALFGALKGRHQFDYCFHYYFRDFLVTVRCDSISSQSEHLLELQNIEEGRGGGWETGKY